MENNSVKSELAATNSSAEQQKQADKEINFARLRQEKEYLAQELQKSNAERDRLLQQSRNNQSENDEDDSDEPYVDHKKLNKRLARLEKDFEVKAEEKARKMIEEDRQRNFMSRLKSEYSDFDQILTEETATKLEQVNPKLAQMILQIPDEYQRRAMAYEAIKTAGLHKKPETSSIQDKVNQNQRNPLNIPSSSGSAPSGMGDYSEAGKKAAYAKMQELMKKTPHSR